MEAWDNDKVVAWLTSKGFGVWTPYFKVKAIDGKAFVCLSLDQLLEAKIDKSSAKKIIQKRDRQIKNFLKYVKKINVMINSNFINCINFKKRKYNF
jgi:outer membrane usher protein FimD/PapC